MNAGNPTKPKTKKISPVTAEPVAEPASLISGKPGSKPKVEKKTVKKVVEKVASKPSGKSAAAKVKAVEAVGKPAKKIARKAAGKSASIDPEERHRLISEAAYYLAERRGFKGGTPHDDWADAEAEIDQLLSGKKQS